MRAFGMVNANWRVLLTCAVSCSLVACGGDDHPADKKVASEIVADTARTATDTVRATTDTVESGGEVASDFVETTVKERWITDANVLSLLSAMNARAIAAADIELEAWHVDAVRAFAASIAREHAELQHSVDSVAGRLDLVPIAPALARPWMATLGAQIDTLRQARGNAVDRAFVHQQVVSHQLIGDYVQQLGATAERPDLRSLLNSTATRIASQLARARALEATLAAADSAAADSAARRAARLRKRTPTNR